MAQKKAIASMTSPPMRSNMPSPKDSTPPQHTSMKIFPVDALLYATMRLLRHIDKRQCALRYLNKEDVKSIIVISSTAIGDTLMSTPAIKAVRVSYPTAHITALFSVRNMALFANNPDVDTVIPYYGGYKHFLRTIKALRRQKADVALILHGNEPQATPLAYLSGARFIVKLPSSPQYDFLLSNVSNNHDITQHQHHSIDVRLKVASLIGCTYNDRHMRLYVDDNDVLFIKQYLRRLGIGQESVLIGFQTGAVNKHKIWPSSHFIALGRSLIQDDPNIRIVLTGSKKEQPRCRFIAGEIGQRAISTAGEITLPQLAALVKELHLLLTNDTGTMHIAIALNTKTVSLFCPTFYKVVGAAVDPHLHRIIHRERPCFPCVTKRCKAPFCMGLISVDEVGKVIRSAWPLLRRSRTLLAPLRPNAVDLR
ncbi:MAG: glycosyltransferase family 9 protein [Nitrospirae bacterium]|nr:glycosyltransferase family 9 protein [Nitrospirota bacterium]